MCVSQLPEIHGASSRTRDRVREGMHLVAGRKGRRGGKGERRKEGRKEGRKERGEGRKGVSQSIT